MYIHAVHVCCVPMVPAEMPDCWYRGQKQLAPRVTWTCQCEWKFSVLIPVPLSLNWHSSVVKQCRARSSSRTLLVLNRAAALCYCCLLETDSALRTCGALREAVASQRAQAYGATHLDTQLCSFLDELLVGPVLKLLKVPLDQSSAIHCVSHPL